MKKTKKDIIEIIYKRCGLNKEFDNEFIKDILKEFNSKTNPYDITKLDDKSKYPKLLIDENIAITHIGNGKHKFIPYLDKIYPTFEKINKDEKINFLYRPSILNDFSISESSILSTAFNHRIINDFLYSDIVANPKLYISERKRGLSFEYFIDKEKFSFDNLQIEIDFTIEYNKIVTIFEAKNCTKDWIKDFNVFQVYNPFRYYYELKQKNKLDINKIYACYLLRKKEKDNSIIRLYLYTFENPLNITSLKLVKKREYILNKRVFDGVC